MSDRLSKQHERLILELLPFDTTEQFHEWLESAPTMGSWLEYRANCRGLNVEESVDKLAVSQKARRAVDDLAVEYLVYHPDKEGWEIQDHVVRFIVTVIRDSMLLGTWAETEWKAGGLDICKAIYEVLCFMHAVDEQPAPPFDEEQGPSEEQPPNYTA